MSNTLQVTIVSYDSSVRIANHPTLSAQDILLLDKYYILYWEARYLKASLRFERCGDYYIERQSVNYQIFFGDRLDTAYLEKNPDHQIRLSFRRLKGRNKGIVLVTRIKGEQNESTIG